MTIAKLAFWLLREPDRDQSVAFRLRPGVSVSVSGMKDETWSDQRRGVLSRRRDSAMPSKSHWVSVPPFTMDQIASSRLLGAGPDLLVPRARVMRDDTRSTPKAAAID